MSFYMKIVPTGDEVVLFQGKVGEDGIEGLEGRLTARVWKGQTNSGHAIEVAIVKLLEIDPVDVTVLNDRFRELAAATQHQA